MFLLDLQQKLSMHISINTGLYPLEGSDEVSGEVVIEKSLSFMLLLIVPEQVRDCHCCSYCSCVFFLFSPCFTFVYCALFSVLYVLFWKSFCDLKKKF